MNETGNVQTIGKVLIVDDEISHLMLEREVLEMENYEVHQVQSGQEALRILNKKEFDVVLLDQNMPGISGDETCRQIRKNTRFDMLPIIMVTGAGDNNLLSKSLANGANDFIKKPYRHVEMLARVEAAIRQKKKTEELDNAESLLFTLARMVEAKDKDTGDHCNRLSHSAVVFGKKLGLNAEDLNALRKGGVLHDIGKLAVPDNILMKNGPLDDSEWKIIREHTVVGAQLCSGLSSIERVVPIIRSHHERWCGGGYPDNLVGEEIPFLARVFQLVDIYDALMHARSYKGAEPVQRVIEILQEESDKGWRDPYLSKVFIDILKKEPEILVAPKIKERDDSEEIFEKIKSSGVLNNLH